MKKFLEEITIKGNQGIPNDPDYLKNVEDRARQRLGVTASHFTENRPNRQTMEEMNRIMQEFGRLVPRSIQLSQGKERDLERLAKKIIMDEYGSILDGVELDLRIVGMGEVPELFNKDEDEEAEPEAPTPMRVIRDPEVKRQVDKAKIANNIMQGEGKNTKNIFHLDTVKQGLERIFGERNAKEVHDIWDRISKLADKRDWVMPIEMTTQALEENPEGMGGAVKVEWKPKPKKEEDEEKKDKEYKEPEQKEEEYTDKSTPVIKVRAVDFPMLLHETVKGIYELIAAQGIPDDPELAKKVKANVTSFGDEVEDWRYGPEIAADLRDFVNSVIEEKSKKNKDLLEIPNLREFVFGKMIHRDYMTSEEFLKLFKDILSKRAEAKAKISNIIDDVVAELKEFEEGEEPQYNISRDEGGDVAELGEEGDEGGDDVLDKLLGRGAHKPKEETEKDEKPKKEEKLTKRDIEKLIDTALDGGNYAEVKRLSDLKEKLYPGK